MPIKPGSKPRKHGHNVVELPVRKTAADSKIQSDTMLLADSELPGFTGEAGALKNTIDDERVKEAMRLAQAFLAIEDAAARRALIDLAERLVSYDWVRKVQ